MKTDEEIERYSRFYAIIEVELILWANGLVEDPIELMRTELTDRICREANANGITPASVIDGWNYPNGIVGPVVFDAIGRPHPRSIGASLETINNILREEYSDRFASLSV